ncbi:MAG TPA: UDP-N-acetylmuramate dehydrogenase [Geminicoccus sp.]|jgi:UDP-N-acetylmuramate dehydrogenase|uniref:UDP-N-acetylmuramate dehydrogenase n=1 Tax=Geminicoccus sp. TaxID=2024832 RepID=UPI002E36BF84|nr:UDP-N-acetylmuramate dehydrogenase [Geminicoccus sp.]HEX2527031.1 UDP-N-acetylmuramate dehydrogenase [Geminicoccus sp.]
MSDWRDDLPAVRGDLRRDVALNGLTWLKVGGPADLLFNPADAQDLSDFLQALPPDLPVLPMGVGSNLLVRDGGLRGVVVRLVGPLAKITVEDDLLIAGAGALDQNVARAAQRAGLAGIEFMIGIPGTIGGAMKMNAGAFGGETRDRLVWAEIVTRDGVIRRLDKAALEFGYRRSALSEGAIVLRAAFALEPGDPAIILRRMDEIRAERESAQPIRVATGGSTFKNPDGRRAWQLVDEAGCRGLVHGHAMVSDKHCNFLINRGGATAREIEELGEMVRARVQARSGVSLAWEIVRIGEEAGA